MQTDFNAAVDKINHQGILYKICSLHYMYWRFCVCIDTVSIKLIAAHYCRLLLEYWLMLCQQCCRAVFWSCYSSLCTPRSFFPFGEKKLISYADDYKFMAAVPSQGFRVTVAESLISDLSRISEWCDLWRIKLDESNYKTMTVSMSHTVHSEEV